MYKQILVQELQETNPDVILIFSSSKVLRQRVTDSIRALNIDLAPHLIQVPNLGAWQTSMNKFLRTACLHEDDKYCFPGNLYYKRVARQIATHVINRIFPSNNFRRVNFRQCSQK